jgi:hypothetical protein
MMIKPMVVIALVLVVSGCSGSGNSGQPIEGEHGSESGSGPAPESLPLVRDCLWYLHSDPDLVNIAFPDTAANYWAGLLLIPAGGEVRLTGEFPFARYMSFNIYDSTLASYDAIADSEIVPDEGSLNPFLPAASRYGEPRRYTVRVVPDSAPEDPSQRKPNTLYAGQKGVRYFHGRVIYRIYVPDQGTSMAGNVDLPAVTIVLPGGQELSSADACEFLERSRLGLGINEKLTDARGFDAVSARSGTNPLVWTKFIGFGPTAVSIAQYAPIVADLPLADAWQAISAAIMDNGIGTGGGLLSNRDNAYVSATANRSFGEIAVISAKAPRTPQTYANLLTMQAAQLRYWSLCTNDVYTQRYFDCVYDEQVPRDKDGYYTIVISSLDQRPANARPECGVAWLNWGPRADSLLILRNMLPDPTFTHAVQNVTIANQEEREVMGDYYPYGLHLGRGEFEALSAEPGGDANNCQVNAESLRSQARAGV